MPYTGAAVPAAESPLPPLLRRFALWAVAFAVASLLFHFFEHFVLHHHAHLVYPYSLNKHDRFYDFTIFTDKFRYFGTAQFFQTGFPINYPAPVALVFEFFFRVFGTHATFAFVTFCVLSFLIPFVCFGEVLARRGISRAHAIAFVLTICILSWPVELIVDGANAEVIVWLAMAIAMWAFATGRGYTAAIFFGCAAALKLFPFVFLALFLRRRDIGKLVTGVFSFLLISVVSLQILGPTISVAYRGIAYGLQQFKTVYMAHLLMGENGVDHSLFASIKFLLRIVFHHVNDFTHLLQLYLGLTAVGGTLLFFFVIRKQSLLNQVLSLSILSIYITAFSGDGTLIHLYYPLAMLFLLACRAHSDGVRVPGLALVLGALCFCVSVESFFVVSYKDTAARYIGPMHAIGLGVALYGSLRYRLGPDPGSDASVLAHPHTGFLA